MATRPCNVEWTSAGVPSRMALPPLARSPTDSSESSTAPRRVGYHGPAHATPIRQSHAGTMHIYDNNQLNKTGYVFGQKPLFLQPQVGRETQGI